MSDEPSLLVVAAGCAVVVGVLLVPLAAAPVAVLGLALWFAGVPRLACVMVVVLMLAGVAGVSVDSADRGTHALVGRGHR